MFIDWKVSYCCLYSITQRFNTVPIKTLVAIFVYRSGKDNLQVYMEL